MKSVLISIQPKWVEKIASGKKTIEVRKSRPKLETPFKCYIYCTKAKEVVDIGKTFSWGKEVIGEFVCDRIDEYTAEFVNDNDCYEDIRRKWIDDNGEEEFEIITSNEKDNPEDCKLLKNSCLTYAELKKYIGANFHDIPFYGWHISDLKIYDKPKELSEFKHWVNDKDYDGWNEQRTKIVKGFVLRPLTRPPQSCCYIESLGE